MAEISTRRKLTLALKGVDAPTWMITNAEGGYYDDYDSPLESPIRQLVSDLTDAGMKDLANRAMDGEFDGTKEESDAWAASVEGQVIFKNFYDAMKGHEVGPRE